MRRSLLFLVLFAVLKLGAQESFYSAPVKIPMLISGSFAELRSNHFHSGIDIKTQGTIGIPVYSVADGYISRIVVSPTGYGKAIYITHPNGNTSVYGHLHAFRKDISEHVKNAQYEKQKFKVDLQVLAGVFPVKKDEMVGTSGNSGSSGGPHLHFEIRDTRSEKPLNPLHHNFDIKDNIAPKVLSLMMVPLTDTSHVKFEGRKRRFPIVYYDGKYHIKGNPAVPVYGEVGFAIETNDYFNDSWNKCGIYSMQLMVDDELYFAHKLDQFDFDESRYINSHIDYETYINLKRRFQKTWIEPGNALSTYEYVKDNGSFKAKDTLLHKVRVEIKDSYQNLSVLEFNVRSVPFKINSEQKTYVKTFSFKEKNSFKDHNLELKVPTGALYSDLDFEYKTLPMAPGYFSPIFCIHKNTTPLHKSASVKVRTKNIPPHLEDKALLVLIDDKTGDHWSVGGSFNQDWITSRISTFGHFAVKVDTIPPTIRALSITPENTLKEPKRVRFKVSDELSGIQHIEAYLDGKWALFEYDRKNDLITHYFDNQRFEFNKKHLLQLSITDYKVNISKYETSFWK